MLKRALSPKEILAMTYVSLPWDGDWARVFGRPTINETWFIHGPSAGGKSSFVMQLTRKLTEYGTVLYMSYEEKANQTFQERMARFKMGEVQGRLRVAGHDAFEELIIRLKRKKSPKFVIVDSFQKAGWSYENAVELIERFPRKCFIFISHEYKGQPMGKPAIRLKYEAGVKIRVVGYKAYCQGRFIPEPGVYFTVWTGGVLKTTNNIGDHEQKKNDNRD